MEAEYYDIYNRLYADYIYNIESRIRGIFGYNRRPRAQEFRLTITTQKLIDTLEDRLGISLRPDAKYFLLTTFHSMIIKPVVEKVYRQDKLFSLIETLQEYIETDIQTILENSQNKEKEISGHVIIDTINSLWGELRTTRMEIWG